MEPGEGMVLEMRPISSKEGTRFICQDLSAKRPGNLRRQFMAVFAALFVLAGGITLRINSSALWHKPAYSKDELVWLAHFGYSMRELDEQLSASSASYRFAVRRAVARNDVIALFDAANAYAADLKRIEAEVQKVSATNMSGRVDPDAMRALSVFRRRLGQLQVAAQTMVAAVDRGRFDSNAFRDMQNADKASDKAALVEIAALRRMLAN